VTGGAVLLATRSAGKLRELRPLFDDAGLAAVDLEEAGVAESREEATLERFDTFEENALAKARYFFTRTGLPALADDSGLEVRALGGAPGVRSKRWSGRDDLRGPGLDEANNETLQRALRGVGDRRARYVCVAAYCDASRELAARGESEGVILDVARGTNGFGYDPYFFSPEVGCTLAECTREQKERVSHRGRAFRALLAQLSVPR
jgi:XTP/dITP diphosphohydrolase